MTNAVFHLPNGQTYRVQAQPGESLMRAAKEVSVPGIDADCGGSMVCGTCHVIVASQWLARLPPPSEMEMCVLEGVPDPHPQARLACQITMSEALAGLEVQVPAEQR